jgi:hypothetical protein
VEPVCVPENFSCAYVRVMANKGSPGVDDGLTVGQLGASIKQHKQTFIASFLDGSYRPQPARGVQIPTPGGAKPQHTISKVRGGRGPQGPLLPDLYSISRFQLAFSPMGPFTSNPIFSHVIGTKFASLKLDGLFRVRALGGFTFRKKWYFGPPALNFQLAFVDDE